METIKVSSNLRISFIGGGTDISAFYKTYGGCVLSSTINKKIDVTVEPSSNELFKVSNNSSTLIMDNLIQVKQKLPYIDFLFSYFDIINPINIHSNSSVLPGSGLGSSSSFFSALIYSLSEYSGHKLDKHEIAELNYFLERKVLGVSGGKQDQYATVYGGFNEIRFNKNETKVLPLVLENKTLQFFNNNAFLIKTNIVSRDLNIVQETTNNLINNANNSISYHRKILDLTNNAKIALTTNDLESFAKIITEGFELKISATPKILENNNAADIYETVMSNGALGGKLLGAGGGGYMLFLIEPENIKKISCLFDLEKVILTNIGTRRTYV